MAAPIPTTSKSATVRVVRPFLAAGVRIEPDTLYTCSTTFAAEIVSGGKAVRATEAEIAAAAAKKAAPVKKE